MNDRQLDAAGRLRGLLTVLVLGALVVGGLAYLGNSHEAGPPAPVNPDAEPAAAESISEPSSSGSVTEAAPQDQYQRLRREMVDQQISERGVTDTRVLEAMRRVPRHRFVPKQLRHLAYADRPLPIGHDQTISQPLIVAEMTALAQPTPQAKALDVGTGSGYQAAVLAELVSHVYSIEILQPLADEARERLRKLGYDNVEVRAGDGYRGWPEQAPFELIIVAAAPDHVPQPLVDQLAPGGRLVIPVGSRFFQELLVIDKRRDGTVDRRSVVPVAFVPMTGEAEAPRN